jgi:hypothetical protein
MISAKTLFVDMFFYLIEFSVDWQSFHPLCHDASPLLHIQRAHLNVTPIWKCSNHHVHVHATSAWGKGLLFGEGLQCYQCSLVGLVLLLIMLYGLHFETV